MSGFAITALEGDWITLERRPPSPAQALLSAQDSTARTAESKLEANFATLIAHIKANRALPSRATPR